MFSEKSIVRGQGKRMEIVVTNNSWVLTLFDGEEKVDTFKASRIPLYDSSCIEEWLSRNGASCLCTPAGIEIQRLNKRKRWGLL